MKIYKHKDVPQGLIEDDFHIKVTDMGNLQEVRYMKSVRVEGLGVKRISKDEYVDTESGETFKCNHSESRKDNVDGLRKTFKKIRHIINANFFGNPNELMLTLTYKENMTDTKQLYKDFKNFWDRFKYKFGDNIDYFYVAEPQGRGAWHCHVLVRFNELEKACIKNKELASVWGKGFVTVRALKAVDNIGAYLSAYLGDIEVCDENAEYIETEFKNKLIEYKNVEVDGKKKKFIKGGRLHLYPVGMHIFRKSNGIKMPVDYETTYGKFKSKVGDIEPFYSSCVVIGLDDDFATDKVKECNRIVYEQYKVK